MSKKSFKKDPMKLFLSPETIESKESESKEPLKETSNTDGQIDGQLFVEPGGEKTVRTQEPVSYKKNMEYVEKKTRRVGLLMKPSLFNKIKAVADSKGQSVNDYIHSVMEKEMGVY